MSSHGEVTEVFEQQLQQPSLPKPCCDVSPPCSGVGQFLAHLCYRNPGIKVLSQLLWNRVLAEQGRSDTAQPSCLLLLLWIQRKGEEWLQFREYKGFSNWWRVMLEGLSLLLRQPSRGKGWEIPGRDWLTSAVHFRMGDTLKGSSWDGGSSRGAAGLCCSERWRWCSPAVRGRFGTKHKCSAVPCNITLTSLGTLIKIPPPVRLLHFFWHLKIWKSHRDNWRCPGDVEQVLCRGTGLCQGQLWNVSHICIPAWDSNSSSSQWPAGLTGLAFCCWIARMASWFAPLFLETSLGDVVSFGRQKLFLLVLKWHQQCLIKNKY